MGFKLFKSIGKAVKKVFKAVGKGLKRIWNSKIGRALVIAGAIWVGAAALGAFGGGGATATAAQAGATGSGLTTGSTAATLGATNAAELAAAGITPAGEMAAAEGIGGLIANPASTASLASTAAPSASGALLGKGGQLVAQGAANVAMGTPSQLAGANIIGAAKGGAEALWSGAKTAGGWLADNPTMALVGGMGLSGAMQSKAQKDMLEDERRYQEEQRNRQTVYGLSYDGKTDMNTGSAAALSQVNQQYAQNRPSNIIGQQTPAPAAPGPRKKVRFNAQTNQWEAA